MGSQTLSILRQGVWASLTGGWYYDPRQTHAANIFHLYVWLLLLCLPLVTHLIATGQSDSTPADQHSFYLWLVYCCLIGVIFVGIKLTNLYLHNTFDSGECVVEEEEENEGDEGVGVTRRNRRTADAAGDGFEMVPLGETSEPGPMSGQAEGDRLLLASSSSFQPSIAAATGPPAYLLSRILNSPGTHLSFAHDDTTAGAVHCFQDEFGNWLTYTFCEGDAGPGPVATTSSATRSQKDSQSSAVANRTATSSSSSTSTSRKSIFFDSPSSVLNPSASARESFSSRRHSSSPSRKHKSSSGSSRGKKKVKKTTVSLEVYSPVRSEDDSETSNSKSSSVIDISHAGDANEKSQMVSTDASEADDKRQSEGQSEESQPDFVLPCEPSGSGVGEALTFKNSPSSSKSEPSGSADGQLQEDNKVNESFGEDGVADSSQESKPLPHSEMEVISGKSDGSSSSSQSFETGLVLPSRMHVIHSPLHQVNRGADLPAADVPRVNRRLGSQESSVFQSLLSGPYSTGFSPSRGIQTALAMGRSRLEVPPNVLLSHQYGGSTFYNNHNIHELTLSAMRFSDFNSPDMPSKPKQYYKLWVPPFSRWTFLKIRFDRLQLLALLDNNFTTFELLASIILAILVAVLGSVIIYSGIFRDIPFFLFCFVIASCQYTLIKSVQPDASSPTHGYNRTIIFSRPIYFTIGCTILIGCRYYLQQEELKSSLNFTIFRMNILSPALIEAIYETSKIFILSFPLIFSFGLLPQVDTFAIYLMEQFEIHVFGGTAATTGLSSAIFSFTRSFLSIVLLYILALVSLYRVFYAAKQIKKEFTYHNYDVTFSIFCGIMVSFAYLLSRSSSDPTVLFRLLKRLANFCTSGFSRSRNNHSPASKGKDDVEMKEIGSQQEAGNEENTDSEREDVRARDYQDPLPRLMEETLLIRLQNDFIICILTTIVVFATHVSTIFTLQPVVEICLASLAIGWGFLLHYFLKHSRKELPWLCFAQPFLKPKEYDMFEVKDEARLMCFEWLQAWLWLIEKNALYPLFFLSIITKDTPVVLEKFGLWIGTLLVVVCGFKAIRSSLSDSSHNFIIVIFVYLFFEFDLKAVREAFLLNYFVSTILYSKISELLLKMKFVVTYVAPWQITWGSAFHAFAQPFSVPHSAMLVVQAVISSILSSPLQPVLGSAIFLTSYVRPIKFWERDYNTKRVDHSNIRLASQLDRSPLGNDDNNLNSIFYEHLTRSLQTSLYGDLVLGRWGQVSQGDCFILASDNLNCLVHIIELGNGLVTFQVRGLEFRGTYCQQREVEALSEGVSEDDGCFCCEPGHLPSMLSLNAAFNQRWLAWQVTHSKYVLEGYSISDNSAVSMLQPYDLRKALITYYVKSVIFYTVINKRLEKWISNTGIMESLEQLKDVDFADLDPTFNSSVDEDFDYRASGITIMSFRKVYGEWIRFCIMEKLISQSKNQTNQQREELRDQYDDKVTVLCFALSLIARRALSAASHHNSFTSVEFLLYGLHALFKGDFRITSARDEWVFQDMELLKQVIAPAVRMAVKLHQDHFMATDDYDDMPFLYVSIMNYERNIVISHEADPVWRNAVLSNVHSLLALRHVFDEGSDRYKFVMLNKRYLSFRVIKVNKECVRGLWAGQQQELIYLRNRNPERGSIQNAKQALRNIINSSCDQPIGYPIYVSPLTTSFAETNTQLTRVIGQPFSFSMFKVAAVRLWTRTKVRFGQGCPAGLETDDLPPLPEAALLHPQHRVPHEFFAFERNMAGQFDSEIFYSPHLTEFLVLPNLLQHGEVGIVDAVSGL